MNRVLLPALCAVTLVAVIAVELATGEPPAPSVQPGPVAALATQALQSDPMPGQVATLLARPLFSPDRKPDVMPSSDDSGLPHLTGIVVTRTDRKAIFSTLDGGRGVVVGQGDQVGAYHVQQITTVDVMLIGADGPHTLRPTFLATPPGQARLLQSTSLPNLQLPPPPIAGRVAVPSVINAPAIPESGNP